MTKRKPSPTQRNSRKEPLVKRKHAAVAVGSGTLAFAVEGGREMFIHVLGHTSIIGWLVVVFAGVLGFLYTVFVEGPPVE